MDDLDGQPLAAEEEEELHDKFYKFPISVYHKNRTLEKVKNAAINRVVVNKDKLQRQVTCAKKILFEYEAKFREDFPYKLWLRPEVPNPAEAWPGELVSELYFKYEMEDEFVQNVHIRAAVMKLADFSDKETCDDQVWEAILLHGERLDARFIVNVAMFLAMVTKTTIMVNAYARYVVNLETRLGAHPRNTVSIILSLLFRRLLPYEVLRHSPMGMQRLRNKNYENFIAYLLSGLANHPAFRVELQSVSMVSPYLVMTSDCQTEFTYKYLQKPNRRDFLELFDLP